MTKKQRTYKPRKALRPAPIPGQDVAREKLYGEFEDAQGIYFCFRSPRHNPYGKTHWARYMIVGRLTDDQINRLHTIEMAFGRPMMGFEIMREFLVTPMKVIDQRQIDAVSEWLTTNMIDEVDHRCEEINPKDAAAAIATIIRDNMRGLDDAKLNEMVSARAWWKPRPHILRHLGMFHSTDWLFRKADIHATVQERRKPAEVESVDLNEAHQASMWQS
jgi:hypothetical protein